MKALPTLSLDVRNRLSPEVQAYLRALETLIGQLQQRVADLETRLGQNSTNTHRPPSSDGPQVKRAPPRPPTGRPGGGQPGHPRQLRPLLPPDQTIPCLPTACRRCGTALTGTDPQPHRHQVLELPPLRPHVTEYLQHGLTCPQCQATTRGALPPGVPRGHDGPRLQAAVALLTGAYHLSKRQACTLLSDLVGVPLCPGQVCALEMQTTAALAPVVAAVQEQVRTQPGHMDETAWREQHRRCWLWTLVTATATVFHVAASRSAAVVRRLLGPDYTQVLTTDRYSAYHAVPLAQRQLCWAHLRRDFQAMIDRGNTGTRIGTQLLWWSDALFEVWHEIRDGTPQPVPVERVWGVIQAGIHAALVAGQACVCARTAAVCRDLLAKEEALWTFLRVPGVEPTNNAAERALRPAVLWRKRSQGTASATGSRFVESLLTVVATCRQQGRHVLGFLTDCCRALTHGTPPPTLVPLTAA